MTLQEYVSKKNWMRELFKQSKLSLNSAKDRQEIADSISCDLSPENLHCDGEISHTAAMRKFKALSRISRELMKLDPSIKIEGL